jgi:hypothetical protein
MEEKKGEIIKEWINSAGIKLTLGFAPGKYNFSKFPDKEDRKFYGDEIK